MTKRTRRSFLLSTIGAGLITSLAGCSALQDDDPTDDADEGELADIDINDEPLIAGIDYPDGFSKDGITDFDQALGTESSYYNLSSVSISINSTKKQNGEAQNQLLRDIRASADKKLLVEDIERDGALIKRVRDSGTVYTRTSAVEVEKVTYNRVEIYLIPLLNTYFSEFDLTIDSLQDSNLVYVATEDVSGDGFLSEKLPDLSDTAEIKFMVRTDGIPRRLEILGKSSNGNTKGKIEFDFSLYNRTDVIPPSWVEEYIESNNE